MITNTKERYISKLSKRLDEPFTMPKAMYNPKYLSKQQKIPSIASLFVNSKIIFNFDRKKGNSSMQILPHKILQSKIQF